MFNNEIRIKHKEYDACINPAVECLGVLFILSDFSLNKTRSNGEYVKNVKSYFEKWKTHKAVKILTKLLDVQHFRYDGPMEMFLNIYYNQAIDEKFCKHLYLDKRVVDKFLIELQDFVEKSNFNAFFDKNKAIYIQQAQIFYEELKKYSPIEYLIDFLKIKAKKLNVLLMFGVSTANYGVMVAGKPYCCVRPYKLSRNFDIDFTYDKPYVTTLLLHEFAHSFINPLTRKYKDKLDLIDKDKFSLCFQSNPYGNDIETVVNESVIRAIECMYVKENFKEQYKAFSDNYKQDGFICLDELENLYKDYLKCKNTNFALYYDKIIEFFIKKYGKSLK